MGVVNILKTLAQSSGPSVTGVLAGRDHFWVAFVAAGSLKAAYDLGLLAFFGGRVQPRKNEPREASGELDGDRTTNSDSDHGSTGSTADLPAGEHGAVSQPSSEQSTGQS